MKQCKGVGDHWSVWWRINITSLRISFFRQCIKWQGIWRRSFTWKLDSGVLGLGRCTITWVKLIGVFFANLGLFGKQTRIQNRHKWCWWQYSATLTWQYRIESIWLIYDSSALNYGLDYQESPPKDFDFQSPNSLDRDPQRISKLESGDECMADSEDEDSRIKIIKDKNDDYVWFAFQTYMQL